MSSSDARASASVTGISEPDSRAWWKRENWPANPSSFGSKRARVFPMRSSISGESPVNVQGSWVLRYGAVLLSALRLAKQKRCRLIS